MEMKEQLINIVVRHMSPELEANQLNKLKLVLVMDLAKYRVDESKSDLKLEHEKYVA